MRNKKLYALVSVVVLLSMMLSVVGCKQAAPAAPGVTDNEIKIGLLTPLTGALALDGRDVVRAMELWVERFNAAGGVNGRKIKVLVEDDAFEAVKGMAAARKLVEEDKVFMLMGHIPYSPQLTEYVTPLKVPVMVHLNSRDDLIVPYNRYIFEIAITNTGQLSALADDIAKRFKPKRVGVFQVKMEYGDIFTRMITDILKKKHNIDVVAVEKAEPGVTDYTPQILRVKAANPDLVIVKLWGKDAGIAIRQMREQGLTVPLHSDPSLCVVGAAPAAGSAIAEGYYITGIAMSPDFPKPGKQADFMKAYRAKYSDVPREGQATDLGTVTFNTWAALDAIAEGLRRAGRQPTRENFVDAMETLKDFDTAFIAPITYDSKLHLANRSYYVWKYDKETKRVIVDGPIALSQLTP